MTNSDLSVHEYEQRAETTRRQLAEDIHALNDQLTPGHMLDEILAYAKDGGGSFVRAFARSARDNPVPSLLVGTGCLLFLADRMGLRDMPIVSLGTEAGRQPRGEPPRLRGWPSRERNDGPMTRRRRSVMVLNALGRPHLRRANV